LKQEKIKPARVMKPLWWSRFLFGKDLEEGQTIFAKIGKDDWVIPHERLSERFSKVAGAVVKIGVKKTDEDEKKTMTVIRIVKEPNAVMGMEAAIKSGDFPSAEVTAQAVRDMDTRVITQDRLQTLKEQLCPNPGQVSQLEEERREHPDVPFAAPEEFMWHISRLFAYSARIECWFFIRNYEELAVMYTSSLSKFQTVLDAFMKSTALPRVMGLILSVGNYLNGGSNRGQADGFDLETLTKLDSIKDSFDDKKDVRHFMAELLFLGHLKDEAEAEDAGNEELVGDCLLRELKPAFCNVTRLVSRDSDGALKIIKQARIGLEDTEECVKQLVKEFEEQNMKLQACLEAVQDPADPLRLELADSFSNASQHIARLCDMAKKAREGYNSLLEYFHHKGMKSSDMLLLWDNLLVPGGLLLGKGEAIRKKEVVPRFCTLGRELNGEDMLFLWDLGTRRRRRRQPRSTERGAVSLRPGGVGRRGKAVRGKRTSVVRASVMPVEEENLKAISDLSRGGDELPTLEEKDSEGSGHSDSDAGGEP